MASFGSFAASSAVLVLLSLSIYSERLSSAADDVLARSRAMYAALNSYADKGVVVNEFGPTNSPSKEQHAFSTYFRRAPRAFYFDFKKASGDQFVIWGDPDAFHNWWKTTGVKEDYPNPNNIGAFATSDPRTLGSAIKIPTLLYANARLQGPFTNFTDAVQTGTEEIANRKCYRLAGTAYDVYGATGNKTNLRDMTVWVDMESLLIRKIVEVSKGGATGNVLRVTTTFEPQVNPTLDEGKFKFTPPSAGK
jgi:outer membrane lipoprotein-sorting protein